jgi:hypothetical protein
VDARDFLEARGVVDCTVGLPRLSVSSDQLGVPGQAEAEERCTHCRCMHVGVICTTSALSACGQIETFSK